MANEKRIHNGEKPIRPIEDKKISKRRFMVFLKDNSAFSGNFTCTSEVWGFGDRKGNDSILPKSALS
jgi:hypothetical protein